MFPSIHYSIWVALGAILIAIISASLYINYIGLIMLVVFFILMICITYVYFLSLREITRIGTLQSHCISNRVRFEESHFQLLLADPPRNDLCEELFASQWRFHSIDGQGVIRFTFKQHQANIDVDLGNQISLYGIQFWYQMLTNVANSIF
jgi:hypothetical protein